MGMGYNKSRFVFSETFNNANGKTSGSGFVGVVLGLIAGVGIVAGIVGYFLQMPNTLPFMEIILKLVAAVTILLGLRKLSGDFNSTKLAEAEATMADTAATIDASTGIEKG